MTGSKIGIVCVAGGRGERFGGDKLAQALGTGTVLECSLLALRQAYPSAPLSVVVPGDRMPFWLKRLGTEWPGLRCVEGGPRRQDSVRRGVEAVAEPGVEIVAIHDGARPLVHPSDIRSAVEGLGSADGCILGQPAIDTVKRVGIDGEVLETLPRQAILLAQTPQVF
ncbi:MAG: 2-C-methyl-D-erythritol 4-phosphate cytidylyltransferase, partial [Acidobacteriota bacterium]